MVSNPSFNPGDRVVVYRPNGDVKDDEVFNAGWANQMCAYVGKPGTIIRRSRDDKDNSRECFLIKFDDGNSWWWDAGYIEYEINPESDTGCPVSGCQTGCHLITVRPSIVLKDRYDTDLLAEYNSRIIYAMREDEPELEYTAEEIISFAYPDHKPYTIDDLISFAYAD